MGNLSRPSQNIGMWNCTCLPATSKGGKGASFDCQRVAGRHCIVHVLTVLYPYSNNKLPRSGRYTDISALIRVGYCSVASERRLLPLAVWWESLVARTPIQGTGRLNTGTGDLAVTQVPP